VPVRDGAYAAGVTVAKLLKHLLRTVDGNPRHQGKEFMAFAGITDWMPFYAETLSVSVEGRADSFVLSVWPVHKAGEAGSIDSWPGDSLPVSDWRDASELGAAVLAAFRVATINGSSMPQ
jgi:hypothetical protein